MRGVPRISLNKLAEYMTATPARRKRIIIEQKDPKPFIILRYTDAQEVICDYIQDGMKDDDILLNAIDRFNNGTVSSEWEEQCNQLCAVAIGHFLNLKDQLELDGCKCEILNPIESAIMKIAGIEVSIRPELSITIRDGKKKGYRGLVKLAFSKTYKLGEKSGEYAATLLHEYASKVLSYSNIDRTKCLVVDIFDNKVVCTPSSKKKRMDDLMAACEEIGKMW